MRTCTYPALCAPEPIKLPGRGSLSGSEEELPKIDLPAADNASQDIPREFPEKDSQTL